MITISIIVCTRNRCESLRRTIESLIAQDFISADYEVIVVDNCSTDSTRMVVGAFAGKIRYVFEERLGLSNARNRGISEAGGEIVAFIDDDAVADKSWLKGLSRVYEDNVDAGCVGGRVMLDWGVDRPSWWRDDLDEVFNGINFSKSLITLSYPNYPYGTNISFKKDALRDDDCVVDEKWLMEYSTSFNSKAKIGGVGGTLKTNQTDIFSRYLDYMQIPSPLIIGNEAHYLVTANVCYRKELISRVGGFIEEISKPGCEDPILSQKIKRLGYLLEYNPRTTVLHFHKNNMKSFVKTFFNYGRGKKILEREIQSLPRRRRYSLRNGLQDGLRFPQALSFLFLWYLQGVAYRSGCLKGY